MSQGLISSVHPDHSQGPSSSIVSLLNPIQVSDHHTVRSAPNPVAPDLDTEVPNQRGEISPRSPHVQTPSSLGTHHAPISLGDPPSDNPFGPVSAQAIGPPVQFELGDIDRSSSLNWLPMIYTSPYSENLDGSTFPSPADSYYDTSLLNDRATQVIDKARYPTSQDANAGQISNDAQDVPSNGAEPGQYYIDGEGGRLPKVRRKFKPRQGGDMTMSIDALCRGADGAILGFPVMSPPTSRIIRMPISLASYELMANSFNATCASPNSCFVRFSSQSFPPPELWSYFLELAMEHFLPLIPIVHVPTFDIEQAHWLLVLSICSIGAMFADDLEEPDRLAISMQEFVRRAVIKSGNLPGDPVDPLILAQARTINAIGMSYSGDTALSTSAFAQRSELTAYCETEWSKSNHPVENFLPEPTDVTRRWQEWRTAEERRRTGYAIWLLDCMWAFQQDTSPLLSLEYCTVPLPCQELLWEAESAQAWNALYESSARPPTLVQATHRLYIEKKLQWTTGEFSRILLIHALIHRTWEVEKFLRQPLSRWLPTASRPENGPETQLAPVWLPGVPLYSKWRNAACDALDTLHWSANSLIGAASGMEHPTVLHLHLSRVILLTPFRSIRRLARAVTSGHRLSGDEVARERRDIEKWTTQDQYKARLAIIHAGVIFWHVRRYSASGFYEPSAVFLAALALWAYGTFFKPKRSARQESTSSDSEDTGTTSAHVDRPMDDELVQLFVRNGSRMQATMTGVGHLCGAKGPERVLVEGSRIIASLANWGCSREYYKLLNDLGQICRQQRQARAATVS